MKNYAKQLEIAYLSLKNPFFGSTLIASSGHHNFLADESGTLSTDLQVRSSVGGIRFFVETGDDFSYTHQRSVLVLLFAVEKRHPLPMSNQLLHPAMSGHRLKTNLHRNHSHFH